MNCEYCDDGRRDIYGSIHAEIDCVLKLFKLNKYRKFLDKHDKIDIFVTRISATGVIGYSRPCKGCIEALTKNKLNLINNIYYTDVDGSIIMENLLQMMNVDNAKYSSGRRRIMKKRNSN